MGGWYPPPPSPKFFRWGTTPRQVSPKAGAYPPTGYCHMGGTSPLPASGKNAGPFTPQYPNRFIVSSVNFMMAGAGRPGKIRPMPLTGRGEAPPTPSPQNFPEGYHPPPCVAKRGGLPPRRVLAKGGYPPCQTQAGDRPGRKFSDEECIRRAPLAGAGRGVSRVCEGGGWYPPPPARF